MINFEKTLRQCLSVRNIFHSEADFQHHLAWHTHLELKDAEIRLEYPLSDPVSGSQQYCDILLKTERKNVGIELKYGTTKLNQCIDGEKFKSTGTAPLDAGRHAFLKDISRLENWCGKGEINYGFAIFLTNQLKYWDSKDKGIGRSDEQFRIYCGREVSGTLSWTEETSKNTKVAYPPIELHNSYCLRWEDAVGPFDGFRYLLVHVE